MGGGGGQTIIIYVLLLVSHTTLKLVKVKSTRLFKTLKALHSSSQREWDGILGTKNSLLSHFLMYSTNSKCSNGYHDLTVQRKCKHNQQFRTRRQQINLSYPKLDITEPKNPLVDFSFFCASCISCIPLCSLSAMIAIRLFT